VQKGIFANSYILAQTMAWGLAFMIMKDITASMSPVAFMAIRFMLAFLALLPFYLGKIRAGLDKRFLKAALVLGGLLFAAMLLQILGLQYTSVTNSAFITSTSVILVPIGERLIFKKKIHPMIWTGCVFTSAGILILAGDVSFRINIGDILTLLCAVCFALQIIFSGKYASISSADALGVSQVGVSAMLFCIVWAFCGFQIGVFKAAFIPGLLFAAIINTCVGFVAQIVAFRYTVPSVAALIYALEPIFATFFAAVIPDSTGHTETLMSKTVIGALAITAGAALAWFTSVRSLRKEQERDFA